MGPVLSTYQSTRFMEELVLKLGEAIVSAFGAYVSDYLRMVQLMLCYCEPAEDEPFENFTGLLIELCKESDTSSPQDPEQIANSDICNSAHRRAGRDRCFSQPVRNLDGIYSIANSQMKKLYLAVLDQAIKIAKQFRRRFDLYGPPDWSDPGIALLPAMNIFGAWDCNVIPSLFPFAVPHILISPCFPNDPNVAWNNGLHPQDHDWGKRLIVYTAPSVSGPQPVVFNAAEAHPYSRPAAAHFDSNSHMSALDSNTTLFDMPTLYLDNGDESSCDETEECEGVSIETGQSGTKLAWQPTPARHEFWIPEDEDDLPALPEHW